MDGASHDSGGHNSGDHEASRKGLTIWTGTCKLRKTARKEKKRVWTLLKQPLKDRQPDVEEGIARAGNGFASAVQTGESLDAPVVRMLYGAFSPQSRLEVFAQWRIVLSIYVKPFVFWV